MADLKVTEEIGLELQKRKQKQPNEISGPEVQRVEFPESDEIDAELKARVHDILAAGEWMNVDVNQIIMPEKKGKYAKFQFRRARQNYDRLKDSIRDLGVVDPMVLKRETGVDGLTRFYMLDGHTRFNILLELLGEDPTTQIPPFFVVDCSDADATLIAEKLNAFSENLDDEDRSFAAIRMYELGGVPQKEIARRLGYAPSMVSMIISAFQDVPAEAREKVESRVWTVKHGIELARLSKNEEEQQRIFENAKKHRYNSSKLGEMVDSSKARVAYQAEAKKFIREKFADHEKTITTGDLEKIHQDTLKAVCKEKLGFYNGPKKLVYQLGAAEIEPASAHTKAALQELGFSVTEGEATIVEPEAEKPKPKMPKDTQLMEEESYYPSICPYCGGRTSKFIAEHFDFHAESDYHPKAGMAHDYCMLKAQMEKTQKKLESTTIYKRLHEDPDNFSLEQMNTKSHQMYKDELEGRKQKWREENLPDPKKTAKKGTKVGEVVLEAQTVEGKQEPDALKVLQKVREKEPRLVEECFFDAYEKYLKKEPGYESQAAVKSTLRSSMGVVSRAFLKITNAMEVYGEDEQQ